MGISVSLESAFVSRILELKDEMILRESNNLLSFLYEEVQFKELDIDRFELSRYLKMQKNQITKKSVIKSIINCYFSGKNSDARYWIIKHSPSSYLYEVIELFPDVIFIQIIRDGRAVYNSKKHTISLNGNKMETNIITAAFDWKLKVKKSEKYQKYIINIRYEDLIQRPDESLEFLLNSLSLNKKEKILIRTQMDYYSNIGEQQKSIHKNVSETPDINIMNKWRNELTVDEVNLYNFINKSVLSKYGYDVHMIYYLKAFRFFLFYFGKLIFSKVINIFKLINNPSMLLLKVNRRLKLLK